MVAQNTTKSIHYTWKKETGVITFDQEGIRIPENLSSVVIEGKITNHLAQKILFQEDNDYFFKFDEKYYIHSFHRLRDHKYTIKIVGNRRYFFGSWSREFYFPILRFRNLDYDEYTEILEILEAMDFINDFRINEAESTANERNNEMIVHRYLYLMALTGTALLFGLVLNNYLYGNNRVILEIYNVMMGCGIGFNMLMFVVVTFQLIFQKDLNNEKRWRRLVLQYKDLDNKKLWRHLVLQYIEGIFFVLVITIVFTYGLTRDYRW